MYMNSSRISGGKINRLIHSIVQWFDSDYGAEAHARDAKDPDSVQWVRCIPLIAIHLGCLGVIWTGWSWTAVGVAVGLYALRMFAITGFYHRYFSHRSFKTSRVGQFVFALLGASSAQRGPLWWAYHHRLHHQHSDTPKDAHSPRQRGFLWAHIGWITCARNFPTNYEVVKDLARYPELKMLNRFDTLVPAVLAVGLLVTGMVLEHMAPQLGVTGGQLLVWGFFISTTALFHATCCINSLAHVFGRKRFQTTDDSRNSLFLALITLGEGWHNNHHHYMQATRQGMYWWEIDITFYLLTILSWFGIIWDLKPYPEKVYREAKGVNVA